MTTDTNGPSASNAAPSTDALRTGSIVRDACMTCGRPWDGRTLPASYTKAWCPKCEAYTRFHANTYVPLADRDRLHVALVEVRNLLEAALLGHRLDQPFTFGRGESADIEMALEAARSALDPSASRPDTSTEPPAKPITQAVREAE